MPVLQTSPTTPAAGTVSRTNADVGVAARWLFVASASQASRSCNSPASQSDVLLWRRGPSGCYRERRDVMATSFKTRVTDTGRVFLREFKEDELMVRAGDLAYRFFLALFPLLLFLAAAGGLIADAANVENPTDQVMDQIGDALPEDAASVVRGQVEAVTGDANPALLSVGMIGALWAASAGFGSLVKSINVVFDCAKERNFLRANLVSVGSTLVGGLGLLAIIAGLVTAQVYAEDIAGWVGIGSQFNLFVTLAQLPIILVVLLIAIGLTYWIAPTADIPFRWISPGAVAFVLLWIPFTVGFAFYVANFASYNATYGALGGIVILMLWFYYTSLLILAGAELNAVLVQDPEIAGEVNASIAEDHGDRATATHDRNDRARWCRCPGVFGIAGLAVVALLLRRLWR